jgi:hypothetical protein
MYIYKLTNTASVCEVTRSQSRITFHVAASLAADRNGESGDEVYQTTTFVQSSQTFRVIFRFLVFFFRLQFCIIVYSGWFRVNFFGCLCFVLLIMFCCLCYVFFCCLCFVLLLMFSLVAYVMFYFVAVAV